MSETAQLLALQLMIKGALSDMPQDEQDEVNNMVDRINEILELNDDLAPVALGLVSCSKGLKYE